MRTRRKRRSAALLERQGSQEDFKRAAPSWLQAGSPLRVAVCVWIFGLLFQLGFQPAVARPLQNTCVREITAHRLAPSRSPNHVRKDLREIQERLRKNIRTYTHVGSEQNRQTPEALSQALGEALVRDSGQKLGLPESDQTESLPPGPFAAVPVIVVRIRDSRRERKWVRRSGGMVAPSATARFWSRALSFNDFAHVLRKLIGISRT